MSFNYKQIVIVRTVHSLTGVAINIMIMLFGNSVSISDTTTFRQEIKSQSPDFVKYCGSEINVSVEMLIEWNGRKLA